MVPDLARDGAIVSEAASQMQVSTSRTTLLRALTIGVWILAGLALVFALQLARPLLVPIIIGFLVSYVLDPIVTLLIKRGIPRVIAVIVVVLSVIASLGFTAYALRDQASALVAKLPSAAQELREAVQERTGRRSGTMAHVQQAADELRQISTPAAPLPPKQAIRKVQIEPKSFDVVDYLWSSSMTAASVIGDAIVIVFLAFYLLMSGDVFRRRLIEIAGPTLTTKKITLQILNDISAQISVFLFMRTLISALVAVFTGVALWAVGLAQPAAWGFVAGVLNVAPYIGPFTAAVVIGIAAFAQFHTLTMAAVAVGLTVFIACVEAYVITPWLTSRAAAMNPVAVFIGLAFWAWLWGLPGLLLAIPMLMILKAIGEHVETLRPLVALLKA